MFGKQKRENDFFENLCSEYYEKILKYLYYSLQNETAANDTTQDVFLLAFEKKGLLLQHPNPGGFLFQTAKNLVKKYRRESYQRLLSETELDETIELSDPLADIEHSIDSQINIDSYIEETLAQLTPEKRALYYSYYTGKRTMAEIAQECNVEETAIRMRFVRLRREIQQIVSELAQKYFAV